MLSYVQMETFTLFAVLLPRLSSDLAAMAGWVEGYCTLSSVLFVCIGTVICVCLLIPV